MTQRFWHFGTHAGLTGRLRTHRREARPGCLFARCQRGVTGFLALALMSFGGPATDCGKSCKPRCSQPAQGCLLERWADSDCELVQL